MTSPSDPIRVRCPQCRSEYHDRPHSAHASLDDDIECPEVSTCPGCGFRVPMGDLVARPGGHWVLDRPFDAAWVDGLDD